jgi:hypothetical protein
MLFGCFVSAVERHCCSLCASGPLIRELFTALRDVTEILWTSSAHAALRDLDLGLLARASIKNRLEASAADCFTLQGSAEMRAKDEGFRTQNPKVHTEGEISVDVVNLK